MGQEFKRPLWAQAVPHALSPLLPAWSLRCQGGLEPFLQIKTWPPSVSVFGSKKPILSLLSYSTHTVDQPKVHHLGLHLLEISLSYISKYLPACPAHPLQGVFLDSCIPHCSLCARCAYTTGCLRHSFGPWTWHDISHVNGPGMALDWSGDHYTCMEEWKTTGNIEIH